MLTTCILEPLEIRRVQIAIWSRGRTNPPNSVALFYTHLIANKKLCANNIYEN